MNYYTTLTEKGQITLPAAFRRKLKLQPGKKLSVSLGRDGNITIQSPPSIEEVRLKNSELLLTCGFTPEKLEEMAESYQNGDGMAAFVQEKYGARH